MLYCTIMVKNFFFLRCFLVTSTVPNLEEKKNENENRNKHNRNSA